MRKHLLAVVIAVGVALVVFGLSGLKLDYSHDAVLSGWNDQNRIAMVIGAAIIAWTFMESR